MIDPTTEPNFQKLSADDQIGILQVLSILQRAVPGTSQHLSLDDDQLRRLEVEELERLILKQAML